MIKIDDFRQFVWFRLFKFSVFYIKHTNGLYQSTHRPTFNVIITTTLTTIDDNVMFY